jgi:hypothetical protein
MRRAGKQFSWLGLGLLGLLGLGCVETPKRAEITPPKEDFHIPEQGLFSGPRTYPDEMLNKVQQRKPGQDDEMLGPPSGPGGGMSGPSMGNPGVGR